MANLNLITFAILIEIFTSIYLPVMPKRPRCMMVYTIGEIESVKIDLTLPQLPNQEVGQNYLLTMRNTETQQIFSDNFSYGPYKKQYSLSPNVIYEYCIQLNTQRSFDDLKVSYSAETIFHIEHSEVKVPENLLKKEDFKGTYEAAFRVGETVESYALMQRERDTAANNNFEETKSVDKRLITISIVEIAIIIGAGVYQYYSLQNYLTNKQYI